MPKFVKGDILLFPNVTSSFHNMEYSDEIDICVVLYSDDINYYFESSRVDRMTYNKKPEDVALLSIEIDTVDNNKCEYTVGLKTLLKKL